ncbi:hypothetical protein HGRIS_004163 [Hohenbuehelia grisea]|uniref:Uncharacterized protein n=1 Tax=Hohenbuehelia grisea TaxID=104357 RepID=A0ABR3JIM7_9AGAR
MPPARTQNPFRASGSSPVGVPRFQRLSRRNSRGAGWHIRGYRDMGSMWINVRRGSYGNTYGQDVNEGSTIREFWEDVVRGVQMEDGFPMPENWTFELTSNKRPIIPSDDLITTIFDGDENVYVKVYDEDDNERVFDFDTYTWEYHVPGRRR